MDIYNLNNAKKFPVVVFTACSNHKYTEAENCIGWYLLSRDGGGSIAGFAESGIGIFYVGINIVNGLIGWMEVQVHDQMYNNKILGQVWANCITEDFNSFSSLKKKHYKTMVEWSMFGDPTTIIQDGDDPRSRSIDEYESSLKLFERFPIIQLLLQKLRLI